VSDRIVVLRPEDPHGFIVDACAAFADLVNETHLWRSSDQIAIGTYAELLICLANLARPTLASECGTERQLAIIDHLVERLKEARAGETAIPAADIADRLHGELDRELSRT
jgi:hypothetical protein